MANPTVFGIDLYDLLFFIGLFILAAAGARAGYALTRRTMDLRLGKRASKLLANTVQYVILSVGLGYGILEVLRLDMAALAASLGLVGIAVAFSSQQIIQNFVAGLIVAVDRRIQLEDWIEMTGEPTNRPARVVDITLTRTSLRDVNGRLIIVPNSMLMSNRVVNYTQSGFVEVIIPFPLPLNADRRSVMAIITDVLEDHPRILPNVKGEEQGALQRVLRLKRLQRLFNNRLNMDQFLPRVMVQEVTSLRINLSIRFWVREVQSRDVIVSEVLTGIIDRLEERGIKLV